VSLRFRLALAFAAVALATGLAVAIAAPFVIGRGFARLESDGAAVQATFPPGQGPRQAAGGPPAGYGPAARAARVQQETTLTVIVVALGAAIVASLAGIVVAGRIVRPLRSLEDAASAVASGDLRRRSGLAGRNDEVGSLGRSFDSMAAELQRSDEARRRLLQDAAHELRTPLAVIDATASAIADGVYAPDERHLATIRDQSRLLARIVDDLRTIGLAEDGRLSLHRQQIRVDHLVSSVVDAFQARAAAAAVMLSMGPLPAAAIDGDRDRLRQVIGALLDNALRHTPSGGRVDVSASAGPEAGGNARIEVADTGPGIAPQDMPRLFDRFYQADRARDRSTGTSGLGLAIVRAIVEAHGGTVGAANRTDGPASRGAAARTSGAVFWIELPLAHVSIPGATSSSM
jgi:two-component system sensor histidine kinase BaeS